MPATSEDILVEHDSSTFTGSGKVSVTDLSRQLTRSIGGRALRGTKVNPKNVGAYDLMTCNESERCSLFSATNCTSKLGSKFRTFI